MSDFLVEDFSGKKILLKGVGKMFYQNGFPVSMAIKEFNEKGIEVSLFHVADECMKNGWSAKTTLSKLKEDFDLDTDFEQLEKFCFASYEDQREMIFNYLFKSKDEGETCLKNKLYERFN